MKKISSYAPSVFLRKLFDLAVATANPLLSVPPILPSPPLGKTIVIGAGKASALMAKAIEENWQTSISGIVVTQEGCEVKNEQISIIKSSHPVPDERGYAASRKIISLASELNENDLCIAVISGGASSLLSYPVDGVSLKDKQETYRLLLNSGASISEINTIRKHISNIKGGRLAEAVFPAALETILISDVPGDDPAAIGSGPTVPDNTTFSDAKNIIQKYNLILPKSVSNYLNKSQKETPKKDGEIFKNANVQFASVPMTGLKEAAKFAKSLGLNTYIISDKVQGEARLVAKKHAMLALKTRKGQGPVTPPCVILSGGETTVTIKGNGRGGPNGEYALALAIALEGADGIYAISCDTDGIDGSEDNAGAIIDPETHKKFIQLNLEPESYLKDNNSYELFSKIDGLVFTGPTHTNINDFRALLILPQ